MSKTLVASARKSSIYGNNDSDGYGNIDAEQDMLFGNHKMWSVSGDSYFPCEKTEKKLPPGQYIPMFNDQRGVYVVKKAVNLDELIVLPDSQTKNVLDSIEFFWNRESYFRKHGFLWKRGMILYGPPGSGKTSTLQQLALQIINIGGIAVYCNIPNVTAEALRLIRRIEPTRPVVVMIEDIDAIIAKHGEPDLLALLDGELQIDNVVFIATTNYPEQLDPRFVQRPSRFDEVILIDMPSMEARRAYILNKNPRLKDSPEELEKWVALTENFSIAALKEVVVAVECLSRDLEATVERIKGMMYKKASSDDAENKLNKKIGFG